MRDGAAKEYPPIGDYALIGDCHTAALISRDGSVDWYCPMRFDAPAVFCRLLDSGKGGYLSLAPGSAYDASRRYVGPTNVLETTFSSKSGTVRLTDLMPVEPRTGTRHRRGHDVGTAHDLVRLVEGLEGDITLDLRFKPTFDYARADADLSVHPAAGAVARHGDHCLVLACAGVSLAADGEGGLRGQLRVRRGERRWVVLTALDHPDEAVIRGALAGTDYDAKLRRTLRYWEDWAATCSYQGPYRQQVVRSALVLKLLTYEPTGAVIAAPTTSLPEEIGGERNWDYRFTWLRDAALILYALMTVSYADEATDFFEWLERTTEADPGSRPRIMYGIGGERDLREIVLGHLEGDRCSQPVRLGNGAYRQHQLDIYGSVLTAAYLYYHHGGERLGEGQTASRPGPGRPSPDTWALLRRLVDRAAAHWQEPGSGIWEVRGSPRQFLYGKLMCWAALDRGLRLAQEHGLEAPLDRWSQTCGEIRQAILERGYQADLGAFTQSFGDAALDASALVIPRIGFLPSTDARVRSTVERIQQELSQDGLIYRYRTDDGLAGGEGTFTLCTFWLVDALALAGRLEEAQELFERVCSYANDVGLLSEEIAPAGRELLGNFPQGFSHLALIGSAVNLAKAAKHGAEEQPENEGERAERASQAAADRGSEQGPVLAP